MSPAADALSTARAALAADLAGSAVLGVAVAAAVAVLVRGRGTGAARVLIADGAVLALSIKTAGALLKTIELRTWEQVAAFAVVLGLRVGLKRVFAWERGRLGR